MFFSPWTKATCVFSCKCSTKSLKIRALGIQPLAFHPITTLWSVRTWKYWLKLSSISLLLYYDLYSSFIVAVVCSLYLQPQTKLTHFYVRSKPAFSISIAWYLSCICFQTLISFFSDPPVSNTRENCSVIFVYMFLELTLLRYCKVKFLTVIFFFTKMAVKHSGT